MSSGTHHPTACRAEPEPHDSGRGTPTLVLSGTRASVQPLGATCADADFGVVPEPSQILLGERRPAAPADRALNLVVRNRRHHHVYILPPDGPIREHRGSVRTTGSTFDRWRR